MSPNILNPQWRYTNAASTNIAKTFARVRREQEAAKKQQPLPSNVTNLVKK